MDDDARRELRSPSHVASEHRTDREKKELTTGNNLGIGLDNASENAAARDADIFTGAIGSARSAMLNVMVANAQRRPLDGTESIMDWWAGRARKEEWLVPDCP